MAHPIRKFFADEHGFQKAGTTHYYGRIDGVPVVCRFDERNRTFDLIFSAVSDGTLEVSEPWLSECKDRKWIKDSTLTGTMLRLSGRSMNGKKGTEQIEGLVHGALEQLREHGFGVGSFYSGKPEDGTEVYQVNNEVLFLNHGEIDQIKEALEERKEEKTYEKENYFLGILGALIGAIAGGILWVLIGHFGYYAWIAGIGAVAMSFALYKKFAGGRVSKLGAFLVFLISIGVIFASSIVEWAWRLYDVAAAYYDVTFFDVLPQTWDAVTQTPEVSGAFFMDLLIGIGVVVVVGAFVLIGSYRENAGYYTIKKLSD